MPLITYPQANGVAIVNIALGISIEDAINLSIPKDVPYKVIDFLDIDYSYWGAYDYNEEMGAEVNIDKAKAIHLDKFRAARFPLLAKLDIDYIKAIEVNDPIKASAIAVQKQELRDVTKITLPDTLAEIKKVWPSILT
jgi:hypothetical protein